jgi:hypothetical protein
LDGNVEECRVFDRDGTEHHARNPGLERGLHVIERPETAAKLNRHPGGRDTAHERELRRPAKSRAIEIDDMEPSCPERRPMARYPNRVIIVDGLLGEVTLKEPDAAALEQIDGRDD